MCTQLVFSMLSQGAEASAVLLALRLAQTRANRTARLGGRWHAMYSGMSKGLGPINCTLLKAAELAAARSNLGDGRPSQLPCLPVSPVGWLAATTAATLLGALTCVTSLDCILEVRMLLPTCPLIGEGGRAEAYVSAQHCFRPCQPSPEPVVEYTRYGDPYEPNAMQWAALVTNLRCHCCSNASSTRLPSCLM